MRIIFIIIKSRYRILIQLIHIFFIAYFSKIHFKNLLSSHIRLVYLLFFFIVTSRPKFYLHYSFCHSCSVLAISVYFANKTNASGRSQSSHYTQWDESPCARVQEWPSTELEIGKPHTSTLFVALCDLCPRGSFLKLTGTLSTAHNIIFQAKVYSTSDTCTRTFRSHCIMFFTPLVLYLMSEGYISSSGHCFQ
jgi:hypothetical protein